MEKQTKEAIIKLIRENKTKNEIAQTVYVKYGILLHPADLSSWINYYNKEE